ncbi:hypothetical protein NEOKW01_0949 [Nematocida sp. AWRm80]|nr:hypothetical protein NEOKW01_0949 [Nematocida sp. AWRm80]
MLVTFEEHEEFNRILSGIGLTKTKVFKTSEIQLYPNLIVHLTDTSTLYLIKNNTKYKVQLDTLFTSQLIRGVYKKYKLKRVQLSNKILTGYLYTIELEDIKILSIVEGIDQIEEYFRDIKIERYQDDTNQIDERIIDLFIERNLNIKEWTV